jgi:hypothetical protein
VRGYTLAQVEAFLTAVDGEEKAAMRRALIVARGAKGKPDAFRRMLRELNG